MEDNGLKKSMDEDALKTTAGQLRKPEGERGQKIGRDMNAVNEDMNRFAIEKLNISSGDNILEIGMGNGLFVKEILSEGVNYTGCDFSETMVEEAGKMNEKFVENGQAKFLTTSADNLPFKDEEFNKIFTINTLYFWENPSKELSEIYRVLKTGGQLLIVVRPKSIMEKLPFTKYGFNLYEGEELRSLLTEKGFNVAGISERGTGEMEIAGEKVKLKTLIVHIVKEENPRR